jgi:hypothetical protein
MARNEGNKCSTCYITLRDGSSKKTQAGLPVVKNLVLII